MVSVGPDAIVAYIGAENGYYIMFLLALFGGVSSFTGVTYVASIITLASAGLNPLGLALASGLAITIGDTIYYLIGRHGLRELTVSRFSAKIEAITEKIAKKPRWMLALGVYIYTAFTPFPNDVLTILLGTTKQPFMVVIPALTLGNATLTYLIATFGNNLPF